MTKFEDLSDDEKHGAIFRVYQTFIPTDYLISLEDKRSDFPTAHVQICEDSHYSSKCVRRRLCASLVEELQEQETGNASNEETS